MVATPVASLAHNNRESLPEHKVRGKDNRPSHVKAPQADRAAPKVRLVPDKAVALQHALRP